METYRKDLPQPQSIDNEDEFVTNSGRRLKSNNNNNNNNVLILNENKTAVSGVSVLSSNDIQEVKPEDLSNSLQAELHLSLDRLSDDYEADDIKRLQDNKNRNEERKLQVASVKENKKKSSTRSFQNIRDSLDPVSDVQFIRSSSDDQEDSLDEDDTVRTQDSRETVATPQNLTFKNQQTNKRALTEQDDKYAALRYDPEYVRSLKQTNQRSSSLPKPVAVINFKNAPRPPASPAVDDQPMDSIDFENSERSVEQTEGAIIMHKPMPASLASVSMTRLSTDPERLLKMNKNYEDEFATLMEKEKNEVRKCERIKNDTKEKCERMALNENVTKEYNPTEHAVNVDDGDINSNNGSSANQQYISKQLNLQQKHNGVSIAKLTSFWSSFENKEISQKLNSKSKETLTLQECDLEVEIGVCAATSTSNLLAKKSSSTECVTAAEDSEKQISHEMERGGHLKFANLFDGHHESPVASYRESRQNEMESPRRFDGYVPLPARHIYSPTVDEVTVPRPSPRRTSQQRDVLQALEPDINECKPRIVPTPPKKPRDRSKDFVELNKQRLNRKTNSASYLEMFSKRMKSKSTSEGSRPQSDNSGQMFEESTYNNDSKHEPYLTQAPVQAINTQPYTESLKHDQNEYEQTDTVEDVWSKQAYKLKNFRKPQKVQTAEPAGLRQLGGREQNVMDMQENVPIQRLGHRHSAEAYQPSVYMRNNDHHQVTSQQYPRNSRRQNFNDSLSYHPQAAGTNEATRYEPSFAKGQIPRRFSNGSSALDSVNLPPNHSPRQQMISPRKRVSFTRDEQDIPHEMLQTISPHNSTLTPSGQRFRHLERQQQLQVAFGKENREVYELDRAMSTYQRESSMDSKPLLPPLFKTNDKSKEVTSPRKVDEEDSYTAIHSRQNKKPWYKVYTLNDYKNLKRDVKLGGLGADLEAVKEKVDQVDRGKKYAEFVRQQHKTNKITANSPTYSNYDGSYHFSAVFDEKIRQQQNEKRRKAIEYSRTIPRPKVRSPSYKSPLPKRSPMHQQNNNVASRTPRHQSPRRIMESPRDEDEVDSYDIIQMMRERHEKEKAQVSNFRSHS